MKTIGIVGGIGPESTIDYYRLLIAAGHTQIIIHSIDVKRLIGMITEGDSRKVADYLGASVETLARAGADIGVIAANTPHMAFDEVERRARIPLVSIVEAAAQHVAECGITKAGLLGTRFVMEGAFYSVHFEKRGLCVVPPAPSDLDYVHTKYFGELVNNEFRSDTRAGILNVIERMQRDLGVQAIILGGTELSVLLRAETHNGLPLLDTAKMHVEAVLKLL
jgi:aspartate racemase